MLKNINFHIYFKILNFIFYLYLNQLTGLISDPPTILPPFISIPQLHGGAVVVVGVVVVVDVVVAVVVVAVVVVVVIVVVVVVFIYL